MDGLGEPDGSVLTLPLVQFEAIFPFYIGLNQDLRILQIGPALGRLLPGDVRGELMFDHFSLVRPLSVSLTFASLVTRSDQLYVFKHEQSELHLRGQLLRLPADSMAELIFLGSPWVKELGVLRRLGLKISDFALHDSAVDLLPALQMQLTALAESQGLAARLTEERARLRQATLDLNAQVETLSARNQEIQRLNEELRRQIEQRSRRLMEILLPAVSPHAAAEKLEPGMTLGDHYHVIQVIGEGGMGLVYEVERTTDGRRLAAKVLTTSPDTTAMGRFVREAQILARMNHPSLISIADIDVTEEGVLYIVMELVSGSSLRQLRARFGDRAWGLSILRQIAEALEELHDRGVIHRDLKPENVLVVESPPEAPPIIKLADFGIAMFLDEVRRDEARASQRSVALQAQAGGQGPASGADEECATQPPVSDGSALVAVTERNSALPAAIAAAGALSEKKQADRGGASAIYHGHLLTQTGVIIGTPLYMAPELSHGSRNAHPASDVFSLGVVAFELLTGKLPFESPPVLARATRQEISISSLTERCPDLAPEVVDVLERCLALELTQRPSAREIVNVLRTHDRGATWGAQGTASVSRP